VQDDKTGEIPQAAEVDLGAGKKDKYPAIEPQPEAKKG